jgi:hypothetical protein
MKEWVGRLIAYVFLGSFCIAGPLLLILALVTAAQRATLLISGLHAEATVIGARQQGSTRRTYAPVFQFTAGDGQSYTVSSDVYGKESAVKFGKRIPILYLPTHPESARIDTFAPLWAMPLVVGVVGAGFCVVPAIMLVAWMRRRAEKAGPDEREAARMAAETASLAFRRVLGAFLIVGGGVLLAFGVGAIPTDSSVNCARVLAMTVGVLLAASGVQVGQWVQMGSRPSRVFGSIVVTAMAVMFGWVAIYGDAANFHGGMSIGGTAIATGGSASLARIMFGAVSLLTWLASFWAWKQVFRPR